MDGSGKRLKVWEKKKQHLGFSTSAAPPKPAIFAAHEQGQLQ
jgi:hypothetical protein